MTRVYRQSILSYLALCSIFIVADSSLSSSRSSRLSGIDATTLRSLGASDAAIDSIDKESGGDSEEQTSSSGKADWWKDPLALFDDEDEDKDVVDQIRNQKENVDSIIAPVVMLPRLFTLILLRMKTSAMSWTTATVLVLLIQRVVPFRKKNDDIDESVGLSEDKNRSVSNELKPWHQKMWNGMQRVSFSDKWWKRQPSRSELQEELESWKEQSHKFKLENDSLKKHRNDSLKQIKSLNNQIRQLKSQLSSEEQKAQEAIMNERETFEDQLRSIREAIPVILNRERDLMRGELERLKKIINDRETTASLSTENEKFLQL